MAAAEVAKGSDELLSLMNKVIGIETDFESLAEWEGYIKTKDSALAELVLRLYSDSNNHGTIVRSLIRKVKDSDRATEALPSQSSFSFDGLSELEMANEILRMERMAHDLYDQILAAVERLHPEAVLKEGQSQEFMTKVNLLRAAEQAHMKLVEQFISKL